MYEQPTFWDILPVTSLPGSGDGPSPWLSEDGPPTDLFGQEVAPASPSRRQGRGGVKPTSATCGPAFDPSSPSGALQSSLESRLRATLDVNGSLEYELTWKHWAMQSGPPICALRARARPISDNGCSGWPTPDSQALNVGADVEKHLARMERLREKHNNGNGAGLTLGLVAQMAGWPTPNGPEGGSTSRSGDRKDELLMGGLVQGCVPLAGWVTPSVFDATNHNTPETFADRQARNLNTGGLTAAKDLAVQAQLSGWATPNVPNGGRTSNTSNYREDGSKRQVDLAAQASLVDQASGTTMDSSGAETAKRGVLNPEHSRWLQGYPAAWGSCGATAMRSSRRSRRRS